jgi:predicted transcriptional regulator
MGMKNVSFRINEAIVDELDTIAAAYERDRTFVINLAIEQYLERVRADHAEHEAIIAEADRVGWITMEEHETHMDSFFKKLERAERRKAS